jgi:HEAT repeat protein
MKKIKLFWAQAVLALFGIGSVGILWIIPFQPCGSSELFASEDALALGPAPGWGESAEHVQVQFDDMSHASIPVVLQAVRHGRARPEHTVEALTRLGPPAVPDLIKSLKDPVDSVRLVATWTLARLATRLEAQAAASVLAALTDQLRDANGEVRCMAVLAMMNLRVSKEGAVPALVVALQDTIGLSDEDATRIQLGAIYLLGQVGPKANLAIPALNLFAAETNGPGRELAGRAIRRITRDSRSQE